MAKGAVTSKWQNQLLISGVQNHAMRKEQQLFHGRKWQAQNQQIWNGSRSEQMVTLQAKRKQLTETAPNSNPSIYLVRMRWKSRAKNTVYKLAQARTSMTKRSSDEQCLLKDVAECNNSNSVTTTVTRRTILRVNENNVVESELIIDS